MFSVRTLNFKIQHLIIITVAFAIISCNKVGKTASFDLEFNGLTVVQDTFQIGIAYNIFTPDLATYSQSTFAAENTNNDLIESIVLTEFDLSVSNPAGANFNALDSIEIFMSAPGYVEAPIAEKTNILNVATEIEFDDFLQSNLMPYLKKDEILFRLKIYLDNTLSENLSLNLHAKFHVDAKEEQD